MTIIPIILSSFAFILGLAAFFNSRTTSNTIKDIAGDDIDPKKLLEKLKIHQLRQHDLKKLIDDIANREKQNATLIAQSFKKIGLIRFNPYRDTGGDQSFSLCVLDTNNNGFILTTIHGREGTRVYAKPIRTGISEYDLSSEEKEALNTALK